MGQVYNITHDGAGNRLPSSQRSFISFKYNGKWIEDYNFIATIDGDALNRPFYGEMSYNISESDVLDGQFYWGVHFNKNNLELKLVTDKITEAELAEFKRWLVPGPAKEFIFAENPNRAIQVRVAEQPSFDGILPYEDRHLVKVGSIQYNYSTTYYRGFLTVTFEADDPFWYSLKNVIDDELSEENLKVILEDNVPHDSMFADAAEEEDYPILMGDRIKNTNAETVILGDDEAPVYLFYGGTAPADTIMTFSLIPQFENLQFDIDNSSIFVVGSALVNQSYVYSLATAAASFEEAGLTIPKGKIISPANELTVSGNSLPYNKITIGTQEFRFTTPSIYTGYNQALDIIGSFNVGDSFLEARAAIRDGINEYYSRAWAMSAMNRLSQMPAYVDSQTSALKGSFKDEFDLLMFEFLYSKENSSSPNFSVQPAFFSFNSKTGEATGTFKVRTLDPINGNVIYATITENVGDMVYGSYLKLEDRNFLHIEINSSSPEEHNDIGTLTTPTLEPEPEPGSDTDNENNSETEEPIDDDDNSEDNSEEEEETEEEEEETEEEETEDDGLDHMSITVRSTVNCSKITTDYAENLIQNFNLQYKFEYL